MDLSNEERSQLYGGDLEALGDVDDTSRMHYFNGSESNVDASDQPREEQVSSTDLEQFELYRKKYLYLLDRLPENFLTDNLKLRLAEIGTPSSLSSISDDAEIFNDMEEEEDGKTIRDLFYDVMISKHFALDPPADNDEYKDWSNFDLDINVIENVEDWIKEERESEESNKETVDEEVKEKENKAEAGLPEDGVNGSIKMKSKKKSIIVDAKFEADLAEEKKWQKKRTALFIDFYPESYLEELLKLDIELPPEDVVDQCGVKSFNTILKETYKKDRGRTYELHVIICIFSYENRPLKDTELPIELEIKKMVYNLNYNTIKPDDYEGVITGCVIANNGVGVVCFELSLLDAIRLITTVKWSKFNQKVNKLRIFSTSSFITSKFRVFSMCRPLLIEDDNRELPLFEDNKQSLQEEVQEYLQEISVKLGKTFSVLGYQSTFHECGIGELPPCAAKHLPSRLLLNWALDCPLLKEWQELLDDLLTPEPYFDYTQDSYPFPKDTFNLRNLYFFEDNKDELLELYKTGYRPKFSETETPEIPLPSFFKPTAERVFKEKVKVVPVDLKNMHLNL